MDVTHFSQFKAGDVITINCHFGVTSVGIYKMFDNVNQTLYCYCTSYDDLQEQVYFSHGERFCSFAIDAIVNVELATGIEIKTLYDKIITQYEKEEKKLYDHFTDSTYYELKDWFAFNCGEYDKDGNSLAYTDDFANYAWGVLCKKTNNFIEPKKKPKMVNLDDVCQWLNDHITNYQSDMMGYVEYNQITDIIKDLKNTFN